MVRLPPPLPLPRAAHAPFCLLSLHLSIQRFGSLYAAALPAAGGWPESDVEQAIVQPGAFINGAAWVDGGCAGASLD